MINFFRKYQSIKKIGTSSTGGVENNDKQIYEGFKGLIVTKTDEVFTGTIIKINEESNSFVLKVKRRYEESFETSFFIYQIKDIIGSLDLFRGFKSEKYDNWFDKTTYVSTEVIGNERIEIRKQDDIYIGFADGVTIARKSKEEIIDYVNDLQEFVIVTHNYRMHSL